jgi:hypothetical protein
MDDPPATLDLMEAWAVDKDPVAKACKLLSGAFPPQSYPGIEEEQVRFLMALDERTRAILTLGLVAMKKGGDAQLG